MEQRQSSRRGKGAAEAKQQKRQGGSRGEGAIESGYLLKYVMGSDGDVTTL